MKNGSFDLAFRTMTIGLLMFLVLSIVSVGIHNLRPGGGPPIGPLAGNTNSPNSSAVVQTPWIDDPARATDEIRREFASSLARVSDRLAGIEQRFATLTPARTDVPTVDDQRLRAAIETTHRRLEQLGDRLTDRIQSVSVASEVELRDLNRQLTHLLDEQQQIQEQMVDVRVAAEHRLRPTRLAQNRPEQNPAQQNPSPRQTRQDRLTQNLEAMVTELASLREQLQQVRTAAAVIAPPDNRQTDERVAVSLKVPQSGSTPTGRNEPESPVDKTVPAPADLDVRPRSEPASSGNGSAADDGASIAEDTSAADALESTSITPGSSFRTQETERSANGQPAVTNPSATSAPAKNTEASSGSAAAESSATPEETDISTSLDDHWQVPVAARPVSTIFPADKRPGKSTGTPRGKTLTPRQPPAPADHNPSETRNEPNSESSIRIALPVPAPIATHAVQPALPAPRPFPAIVAEIVEPAAPAPQPLTPAVPAAQEPRRIGRDVPTNAQRAPLRLADAPVVRPFEVPTRHPNQEAASAETAKRESPFAKLALTSSNSPDENKPAVRGVTNAKWRGARNESDSEERPALRDSRSLFPTVRKTPSDSSAPHPTESRAADSQIPQPLPLPQNLVPSDRTSDSVSAPALIDPVSAEIAGPQRTFAIQASVLHVTADDLTSVDRAGVKTLAVMGGHDFRVNQIRQAVRASDSVVAIYSGTVTATGGVPTRIPIGWLCPHCNSEKGVASGDQLVVTLPYRSGDSSAKIYVEQADGTGRSESFADATSMLIPGASVQITEAAQDGTVETDDADRTMLTRLPLIGEKFDRKSAQRQIMQRIIVLTIREVRSPIPQPIQQLSARQTAADPLVVHADLTAPVAMGTRRQYFVPDSSGATERSAGFANPRPAPPVEE
ncbi:hypothetical protein GC176_05075 [bacterium]|nr:hypothetical protein [bacterium]